MPYVRRDSEGRIESLHRAGDPSTELLAEGSEEIVEFLGGESPAVFNKLDADFVRVGCGAHGHYEFGAARRGQQRRQCPLVHVARVRMGR